MAAASPSWSPSSGRAQRRRHPLVDRFGLLDWPGFLGILAEQGPDAIIGRVRAAEDCDPEGRRWPRGKRHDDASAAFCHLT